MVLFYLANCMFVDRIREYEQPIKYYVLLFCYTIYTIGGVISDYNAIVISLVYQES